MGILGVVSGVFHIVGHLALNMFGHLAFAVLLAIIAAGDAQNTIRLVDGPNESSGRGEVYYNGQWGTVCDDAFGINDANFFCMQLGYSGADAHHMRAHFGQGTGPILLDDLACTAASPNLASCMRRPWGSHNCRHSEDAGVTCTVPTDGNSCFAKFEDQHISYGTPLYNPVRLYTETECKNACRTNATCTGLDFNYDVPPYQNASCWLHGAGAGPRITPDMNVTHFQDTCK